MESSILEKLPKPIFHDILSRQPIQTLLECKLVSQSWLASINDPAFRSLHHSTAAESEASLFLLAFSDWPKPKLQLAEIGSTEETAKTVRLSGFGGSALPDFDLVGSCSGIICLYNTVSDDPLYIYNPFSSSGNCKELPKLTTTVHGTICRVVFGFGFHLATKQYKVVKVVYYKMSEYDFSGENPEAFVLTLGEEGGDEKWRKLGGIAYVLVGPTSEATVNGRLHWKSWILEAEGVVSFDLETEEFQVVPGPKDCSSFDHLVSLRRGCLAAVELSSDGSIGVWVMRRYCVKESWSKEFVIPSYVPRSYTMLSGAPPTRRKKNGVTGRLFKVLWELKDGRVLFLYRSRCLVTYDPGSGRFEDVCIRELPQEFQAFVHMGTLISTDSICNTQHRA